jgi:HD-like signal output (HDOD) protein
LEELDKEQAEKVLAGIEIPPQPEALQVVLQEQNSGTPNLKRVSDTISRDVGLSALVLKAVNSPLYGLRAKVNSVHHGMMILGLKNLSSLVTGLSLRMALKGRTNLNLNAFWESASGTAMVARALSRELCAGDAEDAYLLGLFHHAGIPMMMLKFADYPNFLKKAGSDPDIDQTTLETNTYSTNHAMVGYYLARGWNIPAQIAKGILHHHAPPETAEVDDSIRPLLYLLPMAAHFIHKSTQLSEDLHWARVEPEVLSYFELTEQNQADLQADMLDQLNAD